MTASVILGGARTPTGKLSGALSSLSAAQLGGFAIAAAVERAGIDAGSVDQVIMGQVLQAGQGQNPARQAAVAAGLPMGVPAMTLNKVCLSGLHTIHLADLLIRAGEAEVVVAGGMESMSRAPHLLAGARSGYRFGGGELADAMQVDGLTCAFDDLAMGEATDRYAGKMDIARLRQDLVAAVSHQRAAASTASGRLGQEMIPVMVVSRRGEATSVEADEGIRPATTAEGLAALRPVFSSDGTVTAGNASQISDGATAVVVTSKATADSLGVTPLAELAGYGQVAGPDPSLLTQPSRAIRAALAGSRLDLSEVALFEINEAFASVVVASMDDLAIGLDVVNVNGGAIALGHPIGASGARLALTMAYQLRSLGGGALGAVALCGGGGMGDAALLRALS